MRWMKPQRFRPWSFGNEIAVARGAAGKTSQRAGPARIRALTVVAVLAAALAQAPQACGEAPGSPGERELVIGAKVAPPFAMKSEDGTWRGISIDLWRRIEI